jgi:hypothetical protein
VTSTVSNVVLQVYPEVAVVITNLSALLAPRVATRGSAVLQKRLFCSEGTLTFWAVEDVPASVDYDAGRHE